MEKNLTTKFYIALAEKKTGIILNEQMKYFDVTENKTLHLSYEDALEHAITFTTNNPKIEAMIYDTDHKFIKAVNAQFS